MQGNMARIFIPPLGGDTRGHFEVFEIIAFRSVPNAAWDIQARGHMEVSEII